MALYEWQIGTRYLCSAHRSGSVSFVSLMSVLGLALGVGTLITVLSVMNGFQNELHSRILAVTSHATISALDGRMTDWRAVRTKALTYPEVKAAVPYIESEAMLAHGEHVVGASVRGVLPEEEAKATGLAQKVTAGHLNDLTPGRWQLILGSALAHELDAHVGDTVTLIAPSGIVTPAGVQARQRSFTVTGLFDSGMYEYDRGIALTHLNDAARLFSQGDTVTGVRLALAEPERAPKLVRQLALAMGGGFYVSDWTTIHQALFRRIEDSKSILFIILLLIVAVAAFNIVATLVMIVKEKQSDIAILRTLGAAPRNVLATFAIQGVLIGLGGTLLGALLGALASHYLEGVVHGLEHLTGVRFLDADVYSMSDLPAQINAADMLWVCGIAFMLCALATLYPAWSASRIAPAEALRHE